MSFGRGLEAHRLNPYGLEAAPIKPLVASVSLKLHVELFPIGAYLATPAVVQVGLLAIEVLLVHLGRFTLSRLWSRYRRRSRLTVAGQIYLIQNLVEVLAKRHDGGRWAGSPCPDLWSR